MRLVRFGEPGRERPGLVDARGRIRDLSGHIDDIGGKALLPDYLRAIEQANPASIPVVEGAPRIGPCVAGVGKIVGIGLNYRDLLAASDIAPPPEPIIFLKATSAISGPYDDIVIPTGSLSTDWEVELGVVVGSPGHRIAEADALDHVAGYCVVNDISERDYGLDPAREPRGMTTQWAKGKSCDTFAPLGPWLVTADEIADPQDLGLWLEVDGHRHQDASTAQMIFPVAGLVSYASHYMSLQTGDVIMTGTPAGTGKSQTPEAHLRPGQVVRAGVAGLGEQCQTVREFRPVAQDAAPAARRRQPAYDWQAIYSPSP